MTVIDASRKLLEFFSNQDAYLVHKDLKKALILSEDEKLDGDIVLLALKNFQAQGLVEPLLFQEKNKNPEPYAYVLVKPLAEYSQTVELSFGTISAITQIVNGVCDEMGIDQDKVNPLSIEEKDIQNLIGLIEALKRQADLGNE